MQELYVDVLFCYKGSLPYTCLCGEKMRENQYLVDEKIYEDILNLLGEKQERLMGLQSVNI